MNGEVHESLVDRMAEARWALVPDFVSAGEARALREDAMARQARGEFARAGIGRSGERMERADIRGDLTCWWNEGALSPAQSVLWERFVEYRDLLNRELFLGLRRIELHYAYYPPGTFYQRHVDTFRGAGGRLVSCVLYLNEDWSPADGGELVLYPEGVEPVRVLPQGGKLATFLSEGMPHEVLPNLRGRWSVTGWMGKESVGV